MGRNTSCLLRSTSHIGPTLLFQQENMNFPICKTEIAVNDPVDWVADSDIQVIQGIQWVQDRASAERNQKVDQNSVIVATLTLLLHSYDVSWIASSCVLHDGIQSICFVCSVNIPEPSSCLPFLPLLLPLRYWWTFQKPKKAPTLPKLILMERK